jgi:hypothetical protein
VVGARRRLRAWVVGAGIGAERGRSRSARLRPWAVGGGSGRFCVEFVSTVVQ